MLVSHVISTENVCLFLLCLALTFNVIPL